MIDLVIITHNSKWIEKVLLQLEKYLFLDTVNVVFIDNSSTDETVPQIVAHVGRLFLEEERIKFYIVKKTKEEINVMIDKLNLKNKVIIDRYRNIDKLIGRYLDDTNK